jgi:GTPase SAR1 family protein
MKTLITITGPENSGKTTLMWTVYEKLVAANNTPHTIWVANSCHEQTAPHPRVCKPSGDLGDFKALININGVKLYISSVGDAIRYIKLTIREVILIDADIVFTAIRTRTRSTIIQTEEYYNTEIKPKYSPIEFVSCKYKDPKKISEQNDQLADEIVSAIMKEVRKITNPEL